MKLVNYKRGYIFDCSIHGTIYMTHKEWQEATRWLLRCKKPFDNSDFYKRLFYQDIHKPIIYGKYSFAVNIRVPATEYLVNKYHLQGYKLGNYQIVVSP